MQLETWEADLLLDKLMLIEDYVPYISKAQAKREETRQKVRAKRKRK